MAIEAVTALREGAEDLASARGVVLYVAFTIFSVVTLPVHQTLTRRMTQWFVEVAEVPQDQVVVPETPLALDIAVPVLVAALAVVFLVAEVLRLVAIRSFASDSTETIPMDDVTHRLLPTFVILLIVSFLVQLAVYGGLAIFVIPGLIAAVLTVFVRQAVVLDDSEVIEAFRTSISIVTDNVLPVLTLLLGLLIFSFVIGIPTTLLAPDSVVRPLASAVLGTIVTVYGVAVLTRAYQQAGEDDDRALGPDDFDDEPATDGETEV